MDSMVSRVNRTKDQARRNYNRLSRWYDFLAGSSEAKYRNIGIQFLDLQPGERVLEIGFGTGHSLENFVTDTSPNGRVVGIDLSDGMAKVTQQRLVKKVARPQVGICLADGSSLPFCAGSFDAVFMSFTLELFDTPEIPLVLESCKTCLSTNGRIVTVSLAKATSPGFSERLYEWFHAIMPISVDCRPIDAQNALQSAGFGIKKAIRESMWGIPVDVIAARLAEPVFLS